MFTGTQWGFLAGLASALALLLGVKGVQWAKAKVASVTQEPPMSGDGINGG